MPVPPTRDGHRRAAACYRPSPLLRAIPQSRPQPPSCGQLGSVEPANGLNEAIHLHCEPFQARAALDPLLIHVKGAVDLDLQGVDAVLRASVSPGYIAASIGKVASDDVAQAGDIRF